MVFTSVIFLFYFLPAFLLIYFLTPGVQLKNVVLTIASLIFYAWGEATYTAVMLFSIIVTYVFGLMIAKTEGHRRSIVFWSGMILSLTTLGFFKYGNLVMETAGLAFPQVTEGYAAIHLPLGVSFFTFHSMSYLIDVYRREIEPEVNPITMGTYMTMFPQLVAGPIVRFSQIGRELNDRRVTLNLFNAGIRVFIIGLAQKTLLANTFAVPADAIFAIPSGQLSTSTAWLGAVSYTFQIYFDFAGYSTMAIGLGLMLGLTFPQNFNYPYISQSITEFWRRWHISLSTWFRDYLYIPLGGNRGSELKTYRNLLIVFVLCGLWHGASWTFLVWGLYHGAFLVIERAGLGKTLSGIPRPLRHLYALLAVVFGWVLFRAETFGQAAEFMEAMVGFGAAPTDPIYMVQAHLTPIVMAALVAGTIASMPLYPLTSLSGMATHPDRLFIHPDSQTHAVAAAPRAVEQAMTATATALLLLLFVVSLLSVGSGTYNPFIYFRF